MLTFKSLLYGYGFSEKVVEELLKWYDHPKKNASQAA